MDPNYIHINTNKIEVSGVLSHTTFEKKKMHS